MKSKLEDELFSQLAILTIPTPEREYAFAPSRRWRADFAWPHHKLLVEVEGGVYSRGRHVRGAGYEADLEKYNQATMLGWSILRYSTKAIKSGRALTEIEEFFTGRRERRSEIRLYDESQGKWITKGIGRNEQCRMFIKA